MTNPLRAWFYPRPADAPAMPEPERAPFHTDPATLTEPAPEGRTLIDRWGSLARGGRPAGMTWEEAVAEARQVMERISDADEADLITYTDMRAWESAMTVLDRDRDLRAAALFDAERAARERAARRRAAAVARATRRDRAVARRRARTPALLRRMDRDMIRADRKARR